MNEEDYSFRICSNCGKKMTSGYVIDNGHKYYCSDTCLKTFCTQEEFIEMYDNGNSDTYWTEWE